MGTTSSTCKSPPSSSATSTAPSALLQIYSKLNPAGDRLRTESSDGHVVITLELANGQSRQLLDVQGDPMSYRMSDAYWSPDYRWVVSADFRMLVTTIGAQPITRELTPETTSFYGYDALAWYAVTAADLI